jgi:hypothetical protein
VQSKAQINRLTDIISIDNVRGLDVWAYANPRGFSAFEATGLTYETLPHPADRPVSNGMAKSATGQGWNTYPTYEAYLTQMNRFAAENPRRCAVVDIGRTVEDRRLLCARISSRIDSAVARPRCLLTAAVHGDETTGYILMLRLIDTLLTGYGRDAGITALLDSTEIWICPLENPDGTYAGGNASVNGATRFNANGVDLNRNFPNPERGDHPDGEQWQPETAAMMRLTDSLSFVLSTAFHGGAEVFNYPWDSWTSDVKSSPDQTWWQTVGHRYTAQIYQHSSGYMTEFDQGITDGGDWYIVYGSRQDYLNYFKHCRELTLELSNDKLPDPARLPDYWEYNYRSLLGLLRECRYGINGTVTDSLNGAPLKARVYVENHDQDGTDVYSGPRFGDYYRPIAAGTYTVTFSCEGYLPRTIADVRVADQRATRMNVKLMPVKSAIGTRPAVNREGLSVGVNLNRLVIVNAGGASLKSITIYDLRGRLRFRLTDDMPRQMKRWMWSGRDLAGRTVTPGSYLVEVAFSNGRRIAEAFTLTAPGAGVTARDR